jgi:hypothetical protein
MSHLADLTREVVARLEKNGPEEARAIVHPLRAYVAPGVHEGTRPTGEAVVEWYAGQLLQIVDDQAWFAMNSILNCVDRFVPAQHKGEGGDE